MPRHLPIIAVQSAPVAWDPEATFTLYEADVRTLKAFYPGTRLFLHPEYYLSALGGLLGARPGGYSLDATAEAIPGPLTEKLCALAADIDAWLVPGSFAEKGDDGRIYNTTVAISPEGEIVARYRKCFPWRPWERAAAGSEFVVFDIDDIGRAGLMICYDGWFPEVARQLAWMGADVIFHPSATYTSDRAQELVLAQATATVNQVYVVNVNTAAPAGAGKSVIADPEGHPIQVADSSVQYLTEVIDFDAVSRVRTHGSVGLTRMWDQLDREGQTIPLPAYGGSIRPRMSSQTSATSEAAVARR